MGLTISMSYEITLMRIRFEGCVARMEQVIPNDECSVIFPFIYGFIGGGP